MEKSAPKRWENSKRATDEIKNFDYFPQLCHPPQNYFDFCAIYNRLPKPKHKPKNKPKLSKGLRAGITEEISLCALVGEKGWSGETGWSGKRDGQGKR
uniref:Uncharacterized protein n=1 Tax=Romanomermis culicivorax TaxID=13658 RepID=A0A915ILR0_ROMCU